MLSALLISAIAGLLVALVGSAFDKHPRNANAWAAGLVVFVIAFLVIWLNLG